MVHSSNEGVGTSFEQIRTFHGRLINISKACISLVIHEKTSDSLLCIGLNLRILMLSEMGFPKGHA